MSRAGAAPLAHVDARPASIDARADASAQLRVSPLKLRDALNGQMHEQHRVLLRLFLDRLDLVERQMTELAKVIAEAMQAHQPAITRLSLVPGLGIDSAHQMIAELGSAAAAFPSAPQCCSWVRVCPGRQESVGISESNRCPKGNRTMRRLLNQAAWAAAKTKDSHFQHLFRRLVPKLGIKKAIVAVAHHLLKVVWKILHDQVEYRGIRAPGRQREGAQSPQTEAPPRTQTPGIRCSSQPSGVAFRECLSANCGRISLCAIRPPAPSFLFHSATGAVAKAPR